MPATVEDAKLILTLYEMRRDPRMREARLWFASTFKVKTFAEFTALCPPGSDANASYRMVVSYWDMVGSFIADGVLNADLFYKSGRELLFVYARLRHILPAVREKVGNPAELKSLETAGLGYIEWWNAQHPGAVDAFFARLGA